MRQIVDIVARLKVLAWDGNSSVGVPDQQESLFARMRRGEWVFGHDWKCGFPENRSLDLSEPTIKPITSITWDLGGIALAYDALLRIDEHGYQGVVDDHGVIEIKVADLPQEPFSIREMKSERVFSCKVDPKPYLCNRAHAEVMIQESDTPVKTLPKRAKGWFRKALALSIDARTRQGVTPIAIHPDERPHFVNCPLSVQLEDPAK